jgi:hypothetical protein
MGMSDIIETTPAYPAYAWAAIDRDGCVIADSVSAKREDTAYSVEHIKPKARIIRVRLEPVPTTETPHGQS